MKGLMLQKLCEFGTLLSTFAECYQPTVL